jgi:hypothetical protein
MELSPEISSHHREPFHLLNRSYLALCHIPVLKMLWHFKGEADYLNAIKPILQS